MGYFFLHKIINFIMNKICLAGCELEKEYLICEIGSLDKKIKFHLERLQIKPRQKVKILKKSFKGQALIVKVLGINYALDKNICEKIMVYDA